jgi:dihydrolipoamide dehydrogenase
MGQKVIVIGGGPGGYVAAIQAAHLGAQVTLVEKDCLGGTCVNRGCIPTKALVETSRVLRLIRNAGAYGISVGDCSFDFAAVSERKRMLVKQLRNGIVYLMRKNKISVIEGGATIVAPGRVRVTGAEVKDLDADKIIIATGSEPILPPIAGIGEAGVITSDGALEMETLPGSMIIIGGGVIGLEFAQIFRRLNVEVAVIEMEPQLLPCEDAEIARTLEGLLKKEGIDIYTRARVNRIGVSCDGRKEVVFTGADGEKALTADRVLVSVGRRPRTEGLGLEALGIASDRGRIAVNVRMETNIRNVYAVGDAVGGVMLAHKAMAEGRCAAKNALGVAATMDYKAVPRCIWTSPEVAAVGLSETEAREQYEDVRVSTFPFTASGKARILDEADGFVKIVAETKYGELLGVHIVGPQATELISEAVLAIQMEATFPDLNRTIHPHPTLSEALLEAGLGLEGKSFHF